MASLATLLSEPKIQISDANGVPISGGSLTFYAAGTTTKQAAYADASGNTPLANPVSLDAGGYAPNIYITGLAYRVVAKDQFGVTVWDVDNISTPGILAVNQFIAQKGVANGLATLDSNIFVPSAQLNYNLNTTGSVNRLILSKLSDQVSVKDFGAVGNGTADDTAAIQAAINYASGKGKALYFPGGNYLVTNLQVPHNTAMFGQVTATGAGAATNTTVIKGTAGLDIMSFIDTEGNGYPDGFHFECLQFSGGLSAINWGYASSHPQSGITGLTMRDCSFNNQSFCSVTNGAAGRWIERAYFEHTEFSGGQYGFYMQNGGASANTYIEKATFIQCRFGGTISGLKVDIASHCEDTNLFNCIWNGCGQHAIDLRGPCNNWSIYNPAFEVNCYSAPPVLCQTTCNTTAGSNIIVAATATGLVAGQALTIQAAGTNGVDWYPNVVSIAGTSITVDSTAPLTVTGNELTNAIYDETHFDTPTGGGAAPARINFWGGSYGIQNTGGNKSRYGIYSPASTPNFFGCQIGRPLYDPQGIASLINTKGSNVGSVRVGTNLAAGNGSLATTRLADGRSPIPVIIPGNPGQGSLVTLPGSGANVNTGPFGKFRVMNGGFNRSPLFVVDGDTGMTSLMQSDGSTAAKINFGVGVNTNSNTNGSVNAVYIANGTAPSAAISGVGTFYVLGGELYYLSGSNVTTQITGLARFPQAYGQVSLTDQTAAIGSTAIYNGFAGMYRASIMIDVRTAATSGNIIVAITAANTNLGGTASGSVTIPVNALGSASGTVNLYNTGGSTSYTVTFSSVVGSPHYDLYIFLERLF